MGVISMVGASSEVVVGLQMLPLPPPLITLDAVQRASLVPELSGPGSTHVRP